MWLSPPLSPPLLGVTSQLCHSNVSRPNSALGRGRIQDPVPRCVALANQRLRPPRLWTFSVFFYVVSLHRYYFSASLLFVSVVLFAVLLIIIIIHDLPCQSCLFTSALVFSLWCLCVNVESEPVHSQVRFLPPFRRFLPPFRDEKLLLISFAFFPTCKMFEPLQSLFLQHTDTDRYLTSPHLGPPCLQYR